MQPDGLVTKVTQIIQRKDGSEVRIVAEAFHGSGLTRSIDVRVHKRGSPGGSWMLCSNRPHPNWHGMSVDQYVSHGRSEMLQAASPGEILRAVSAIGKPMSYVS